MTTIIKNIIKNIGIISVIIIAFLVGGIILFALSELIPVIKIIIPIAALVITVYLSWCDIKDYRRD